MDAVLVEGALVKVDRENRIAARRSLMARELTHDAMVAVERGGSRTWRCVRCGRDGLTIAEVNEVDCLDRIKSEAEFEDILIGAIEGRLG